MAFDREAFSNWLRLQGHTASAEQYPSYLVALEELYQWDIDSILPAAFAAADAQVTADKDALNPATHEARIHELRNWRAGLRKYQAYLTQPG